MRMARSVAGRAASPDHQADIATGVEETMRALDDLVSQRMVRYVGVSNWEAWRIMKANSIADKRGFGSTGVIAIQVRRRVIGKQVKLDKARHDY